MKRVMTPKSDEIKESGAQSPPPPSTTKKVRCAEFVAGSAKPTPPPIENVDVENVPPKTEDPPIFLSVSDPEYWTPERLLAMHKRAYEGYQKMLKMLGEEEFHKRLNIEPDYDKDDLYYAAAKPQEVD